MESKNPAHPESPEGQKHLKRDDKWMHLYSIAEQISNDRGNTQNSKQMIALLESVLEVFPKELDPLEDFESFAVRQFTKALHRALQSDTDF